MESRTYWGILGKFWLLTNPARKMVNYPEFLSGPNETTTDAWNLCHLNNCRLATCEWKKICCKSAQAICIKHYNCDCRVFVSETFFYAKKQRQNTLFLPIFLDVENRHFKFCYRKCYKIPPKSGFLVAAWDVEISGNYQWRQSLSRWSPASWFEIMA